MIRKRSLHAPTHSSRGFSQVPSFRHLQIAIVLVLTVLIVGTVGYMEIEQLSFFDALYTTVDMMATIGSSSHPDTEAGRIFTLFVVVFGVGSLLYTFGAGMEFIIEGHFNQAVRRHLMDRKIGALRNHCIICGFGRVGSQIAEDFTEEQKVFIVVDENEQNIQTCLQCGYLALQGDATRDDILREAGIEHARTVLVATDNDAHNISITLSARHLKRELFIVARANRDETKVKLKLAGANRVLSPYTISGHYMANLVFEPAMVELFEAIMQAETGDLVVEEVELAPTAKIIGQTMRDAQNTLLHQGVVLVALKRYGSILSTPTQHLLITRGDSVVVIGKLAQITAFCHKHMSAAHKQMFQEE
ncbi:potassium transporter TrkA [Ktedonobacter sp. SOSP1-52]|uniref:potassium channel family protein n=1 Tax=Ktedonobacter sp. SOSP1-52 TaxID=2778366 RepID=UPI0019150DF7|nr:potassium channel protein [Ktedonobacter sp. SOSP1-52]GHO69738.1 potassium transporter TrkA [Ktedonobacter sp. SOSP1-52]